MLSVLNLFMEYSWNIRILNMRQLLFSGMPWPGRMEKRDRISVAELGFLVGCCGQPRLNKAMDII